MLQGLMTGTPPRAGQAESMRRRAVVSMLVAWSAMAAGGAWAGPAGAEARPFDTAQWMERLRAGPCARPYAGTLVVSSAGGQLSSARLWGACVEQQPLVRVEPLSGVPRTVFRHGEEVRTVFPQQRLMRIEPQGPARWFPAVVVRPGAAVARHYGFRPIGPERVAGMAAEGVVVVPQDAWRYGYRFWTERDTGLVLKLQTLGPQGQVLEQTAFSHVEWAPSLDPQDLLRAMEPASGDQVRAASVQPTSLDAEGWALRQVPPGFDLQGCALRRAQPLAPEGRTTLHCVFSDGLASVSLFLEPRPATAQGDPVQSLAAGATQVWAQRLDPQTWLTAVGEVPPVTLRAFAQHLERIR